MDVVRNLRAIAVAAVALTAALVLSLTMSAVPASASEGCENEARRVEQASTFLPDCRAYELVSQPSQPTPSITPFLKFENVPVAVGTEFYNNTNYSLVPDRLPIVPGYAFVATDGHAALYKGEEPNAEANLTEDPINLSTRGSEGWTGENIIPHESAKSGWGCKGSAVEGVSVNLQQIVVRMGGGGGNDGEDYEHCDHDEPPLAEEGESKEAPNLFLRENTGPSWKLLSVYPPGVTVFDPGAASSTEYGQYNPVFDAASADGAVAVLQDQAQLTSDAPNGETYTYSTGGEVEGHCPDEFGNLYVWSAGMDHTLTVPPTGIPVRGTLAGAHADSALRGGCERWPQQTATFTNPISVDGRRIAFYAGGGFKREPSNSGTTPGPRAPYIDGGLYLRENPVAAQSALVHGGAAGTGTLTAGSKAVGSLRVTLAAGVGQIESGSNEVTDLATLTGRFAVGQTIEGQGIPAGTTISEVTERTIIGFYGAAETRPVVVLSNKATESIRDDKLTATAEGPAPFAVGQTITGRGIPAGTTIAAVASGSLTLSASATASGGVSLESSSECTEAEKACTVQIDVPQTGAMGSPGGGQFQWANTETTKIFFTDEEKLTTDSTAEPGQPDLYEYDVEKPVGQRLADLTVNASEPADVQGVAGVSKDGSYIYFVAQANLTGHQQNSHGANAPGPAVGIGMLTSGSDEVTGLGTTSGAFEEGMTITASGIPAHTAIRAVGSGTLTLSNDATESGTNMLSATAASLYLRHEGTTTFIATLNAEGGDQCDWTAYCLTSRVSQNGLYIAFNSIDSLTGYDNHPVKPTACNYLTSGSPNSSEEAPCVEAYRYAAQEGAHGELTCATCNPAGPPQAEFPWSLVRQAYREGPATYGHQIMIDHPMADSGQFFFETEEKLVPADENGTTHNSVDVYEYSGGEGPTAQYHLISTGKSGTTSEFIDASSDGSNVFFSTAESLVHADTRSGYDIYDARVNGGLRSQSEAIQPPACTSVEGCRSPLTEPPGEFSAGSAALVGAGNLTVASVQPQVKKSVKSLMRKQRLERALKACTKRYRHKPNQRNRCKRQALGRYGAKTSRNGRAGK